MMDLDEHKLFLSMLVVYAGLIVMAIPVNAGFVSEDLLKYVLIPIEVIGATAILIMGLLMLIAMHRKK